MIMGTIALLSFVLEKAEIIHPWILTVKKSLILEHKIEINEIDKLQEWQLI